MAAVSVYSVKGGVGKSTIAANLAWVSAVRSGHTTLLWDLDAAGGGGFLFGVEAGRGQHGVKLFSDDKPADDLIWHSGYAGLDVLPGDATLRSLDVTLHKLGKKRPIARLLKRFAAEYQRVIVDCPPVLNELSSQVVRSSDVIILPITPSALSRRALDQIREDLAKNHPGHPPALPVLSMVDMRRALHRQTVEENPDWPVIPMASVLERAAGQGAPIGVLAPSSPAAQALERLWAAIDRKLENGAAK